MPFADLSVKGGMNATADPYDWGVEEVITELCDPNSRLRTAHGSQFFPNEISLAAKLREHDVTGLALLQNVDADCLKNEFGIKSMGQRACLEELIEALQQESLRYQERQIRRASNHTVRPSIGWRGRAETPYLSTRYEAGAPAGDPGIWKSPQNIPNGWHASSPPGKYVIDDCERIENWPREVPLEVPRVKPPDWPAPRPSVAAEDSYSFDNNSGKGESSNPDSSTEGVKSTPDALHTNPLLGDSSASNVIIPTNVETTITDQYGRERRRLAPTLLTTSAPSKPRIEDTAEKQSPNLTLSQVMGKFALVDGRSSPNNAEAVLEPQVEERQVVSGELDPPSDGVSKRRESLQGFAAPGAIHIDEYGRKRVIPIRQLTPDIDTAVDSDTSEQDKVAETRLHHKRLVVPDVAEASTKRGVSFGRKAQRSVDQIYLGFESFGVDKLFYGDTELEQPINGSSSAGGQAGLDKFIFTCPNSYSAAQKRYVHSRMKYYLRSPLIVFDSKRHSCHGIVPYPSHIAMKYRPLSMTIFQKSTSGDIRALRSNRAKWIEDTYVPKLTTQGGSNSPVAFEVADPALAMDDDDDIGWKALEKWKYIDGDDEVLPTYGESSSDGEYDLDTWKEMEQEAGHLERVKGHSRKRKMTPEEVQAAIDAAIERIVEDWGQKRRLRLQPKAWRIWMRAKRDNSRNAQIHQIEEALTSLKKRISNLRNEIAKEEWSKSSKVSYQCKIMQPSVFDRETLQWEKAVLQLPRAPERVASFAKQRNIPLTGPGAQPPLEHGEERIATDSDDCSNSAGTSDDFIVDDDEDASDSIEPNNSDNDPTMADVEDAEDGVASDILILRPDLNENSRSASRSSTQSLSPRLKAMRIVSKATPSGSHIIDLTQASSDGELLTLVPKTEQTFEIRTPPVNSESDTDIFFRANNNQKPVFKPPPLVSQNHSQIIELDTTTDDEDAPAQIIDKKPPHNNVGAIKKMNPSMFLEQQDRKRLLVWIIAHTPTQQRNLAIKYLTDLSMEILQEDVREALTCLMAHRQRLRRLDCERSESMMQIAAWFVSWSVVVKYSTSGLAKEDVKATLCEIDGFEDFYDFLLLCLKPYDKSLSRSISSISATPQKAKKQKIIRDDYDCNIQTPSFCKRVYAVPVSQESLKKTQSAIERQMADEQRRKEELKLRRAKMQGGKMDATEVIVNPGKLKHQEYIHLDPKFGDGAHLKPHQEEGLQFLWREITADHEDLQGCLLAQTMGLGKTIQVIALLVALSQAGKSPNQGVREQVPPSLRESHTLVLCPPALVENWWDEFLLWVPDQSDSIGRVHKISAAMKLDERVADILTWDRDGGILIMGYAAFRGLIANKGRKARGGQPVPPPLEEVIHRSMRTALLVRTRLVIADEAHEFKNAQSGLSLLMNQIKTRSRIALTGSPLANNLGEYYSLVDWVAPKYLGSPTEFRATYQEDIDAGLYRDSTEYQYREARKRLKALELVMAPKVHRADVSTLHKALNGKMEFVVKVPLTPLQNELYRIFVDATLHASAKDEPKRVVLWTWLHILQLLCNHPKLFKEKLRPIEAELEAPSGQTRPAKKKTLSNLAEDSLTISDDDEAIITEVSSQGALGRIISGARDIFDKVADTIDSVALSNKMQVLMAIIDYCSKAQDKMLIFSHRIPTLDYISDQLRGASIQFERIDGTVDPQKRQAVTKSFNEKSLNVCLISTRAGGQGLNLFGANRVVILDDWFNPMWEQQAIGRAYRIGQKKPVYVYRLTTAGTFEQAIQNQALFKEQLATRVVDKRNPIRGAKKGAGQYLFTPSELQPEDLQALKGKDPLVLDHLLATRETNPILSIIPSETFQIDDGLELTPEEKREVEQLQKDEELRRRDPVRYSATIMQRKVRNRHGESKLMENPSLAVSTAPRGFSDTSYLHSHHPSITAHMAPSASTAPTAMENKNYDQQPSGASARDGPLELDGINPSLQPITSCQRALPSRTPASSERNSSPVPCAAAQSSLLPAEKLTQDRLSPQPSRSIGKVEAPAGQSRTETHIREELNEHLGFISQTRCVATDHIPVSIRQSARRDLQDAISSKLPTSNGTAGSITTAEIYATQIASLVQEKSHDAEEFRRALNGILSLIKREIVDPATLVRLTFGIHNPPNPGSPPLMNSKRAIDVTGNTAKLSVLATDSQKDENPKSTLVKEYNWKTPPRGKKRNLLTDDDPIEVMLPSKKHKITHSII
ncbi:MAG: hypothetical protein Q9217_000820 [Psora testacea]